MKRKHQVVVNVTFDKRVSRKQAVDAAYDCIHGEHSPFIPESSAEHFFARVVKSAKDPKGGS